jgi:glyoxylase-like metal-dependent hydrolase (beta-lactamase superfamily II)
MTNATQGTAVDISVGDVRITRIEETYEAAFPCDMLIPAFNLDVVDNHGPEVFHKFFDPATNMALVSVHSWLVRTPRSTILVDTCTGNHKERPAMPAMHQLDIPWLDRLAAAGVQPADVDYVLCTHLHLDHVGWNTRLVDGKWVPTFPNAKYVINQREFDFWQSNNPAEGPLEFMANVFDDSVAPVFDRDLVQFWDGDADLDEVFHLEMAIGHTPGNAVAWLESKGERALFAGDSMHSPMQVFEPSWNCGFDADGEQAHKSRAKLLETCAERNALLLPAHFSAPHVFKVQPKGNGLAAVAAI